MSSKLVRDEIVVLRTLQEVKDFPEIIIFLMENELIDEISYKVTVKGKKLLEEFCKPSIDKTTIKSLSEYIQEKFRRAVLTKRGELGIIEEKLIQFFKKYPHYSIETVIKATDNYIDSLKGDYSYISRADYFVSKEKNINGKKVTESILSMFCQDIIEGVVNKEIKDERL